VTAAGAWPEPGVPQDPGAFLTGDELRELLGADAPPASVPPAGPEAGPDPGPPRPSPPRVLIVSRRSADVDLLTACLDAAGAISTVARNPFTALDRVRLEEPDIVVSDLDLWANDGALLLQRVRRLGREPPLLFMADRARAAGIEDRIRRAGAAGVLLRPLRPGEVEDRLGELLRRSLDGSPPAREPPAAAVESGDGAGRGAAARPGPGGAGSVVHAELAWLRFHHGASRVARLDAPRAERARALARRALEDLLPRAAAITFRDGERVAAVIEAAEGLSIEDLGELFGPARADRSAIHVRCGDPDAEVGLLLAGLPSSIVDEGASYLDDVRLVLAAALLRRS
jgi:CheY-like chemotaxis protein